MSDLATSLPPDVIEARRKTVGASEVAALFHLHPRLTAFELALIKKGEVPESYRPEMDQDTIEGGIFMEDGIARWAAHRTGWHLRKGRTHIVHPSCEGWGATPDYLRCANEFDIAGTLRDTVALQRCLGPVEVKRVNFFARGQWLFDGPDGEAPVHIELQLQAQMGALGKDWGAIVADLGGKLVVLERETQPEVQEAIGEAITNFWETLRRGDVPEVDLSRDAKLVKALYQKADPAKVITADERVREAAAKVRIARDAVKDWKSQCEEAEAHLLTLIGDAGEVDFGNGEVLYAKVQHRKGYTAVVEECDFRVLRFGKRKGK